ncbi:MAG: TraR/DksA family transcriptional regulator [Persicimonas sp.]
MLAPDKAQDDRVRDKRDEFAGLEQSEDELQDAGQDGRREQILEAVSGVAPLAYGFCNACEEPIALERLEIRPESPICMECQSERER